MLKKCISLSSFLYLFVFSSFIACSPLKVLVPEPSDFDKAEMSGLFPETEESDFALCSTDFNERRELRKSLACFNDTVDKKDRLSFQDIIDQQPNCYLIKSSSKNVQTFKHYNAMIFRRIILLMSPEGIGIQIFESQTMGLFSPLTNNIYIADNVDNEKIYRHEILHWFLKIRGLENDNSHSHPVWGKCEDAQYEPSAYSKFINWFRRFGELFE